MITMVIIAAVALMLTFTLMRSTARSARRSPGGIRWRGIDWSQDEQGPDADGQLERSDALRDARRGESSNQDDAQAREEETKKGGGGDKG